VGQINYPICLRLHFIFLALILLVRSSYVLADDPLTFNAVRPGEFYEGKTASPINIKYGWTKKTPFMGDNLSLQMTCEGFTTLIPANLAVKYGDFNKNGIVDLDDKEIWFEEYKNGCDGTCRGDADGDGESGRSDKKIWQAYYNLRTGIPGDFNKDGRVTPADYEIWRKEDQDGCVGTCLADANKDGNVDRKDKKIYESNLGQVYLFLFPGDVNKDGSVNQIDKDIWAREDNYGCTGPCHGDANGDGNVDRADKKIIQANFGRSVGIKCGNDNLGNYKFTVIDAPGHDSAEEILPYITQQLSSLSQIPKPTVIQRIPLNTASGFGIEFPDTIDKIGKLVVISRQNAADGFSFVWLFKSGFYEYSSEPIETSSFSPGGGLESSAGGSSEGEEGTCMEKPANPAPGNGPTLHVQWGYIADAHYDDRSISVEVEQDGETYDAGRADLLNVCSPNVENFDWKLPSNPYGCGPIKVRVKSDGLNVKWLGCDSQDNGDGSSSCSVSGPQDLAIEVRSADYNYTGLESPLCPSGLPWPNCKPVCGRETGEQLVVLADGSMNNEIEKLGIIPVVPIITVERVGAICSHTGKTAKVVNMFRDSSGVRNIYRAITSDGYMIEGNSGRVAQALSKIRGLSLTSGDVLAMADASANAGSGAQALVPIGQGGAHGVGEWSAVALRSGATGAKALARAGLYGVIVVEVAAVGYELYDIGKSGVTACKNGMPPGQFFMETCRNYGHYINPGNWCW
jgi:hypothetical protein